MTKHKNPSEWKLLYNNFLEHKGTMVAYCDQNNIKYKTFKNWCYKFKKLNTIPTGIRSEFSNSNKTECSKFIKLQLPLDETMTIKLPNGVILELISKNLSKVIKELVYVI